MRLRLPLLLLPCLFASFSENTIAAEGTLKLFILTGQSNALGAVKSSPLSPELLDTYKSSEILF